MNIRLVLFDLDGTLLDSLTDLHETVNEMLEHFGCRKITLEQARSYVGNGMKKLVERSLPDKLSEEDFSKRMDFFVERYALNMKNHTKPYPDIIYVLKKLKNLGIKTAVVSNKNRTAVESLCKEHFGDLVDFAVGVDEKHLPKPEVSMALEAAGFFGVKAEQCVIVGDGETDIQTARNFGAKSIAALWGFRSRQTLEREKPDYFAQCPQEILSILQKIIDL